MLTIEPIQPQQVDDARRIISAVAGRIFEPGMSTEEFAAALDAAHELDDLDDLPAHYDGQSGLFLVAMDDGRVVGTSAIRPHAGQTAELRRVWLLEDYHGQGIGYLLVSRLIEFARQVGYHSVVLQTNVESERALGFYRKLGFVEIPPYYDEPWEGEIFMALQLDG